MRRRTGSSTRCRRVEARIDESLGFPTRDPHGDPIPGADLSWPPEPDR